MSNILIEGMEMPTEGGTIVVYKISGKFFAARAGRDELFPIVPVPPHGRLIDADNLANSITGAIYRSDIREAPTVVPAEEAAE